MSSKGNSVSQHNSVNIPTICLDAHIDSFDGSDSCMVNKLEQELCASDELTFTSNESFFLSRLSYLSEYKKFVIAVVLLAQCDEGYRRAAGSWLHDTELKIKEKLDQVFMEANDADILTQLQNSAASTSELSDSLKKLIPFFGLQFTNKSNSRYIRRGSTPSPSDYEKNSSPEKCLDNINNELKIHFDPFVPDFQILKRHCLELVSKVISSTLSSSYDSLIKEARCFVDVPLKEVTIQTSAGQLLLITMLHPTFTEDDRKWLLSSIRNEFNANHNEESKKLLTPEASEDILRTKLFECILDLGSDLSYALHCVNSDISLSHSLTSSGFLSGCGGSDSQYDLFLDTSNSSSHSCSSNNYNKTNYGALLTVPNSDTRSGTNTSIHHHNCFCALNSLNQLSHRRLSDIPAIVNCKYSSSHSSSEGSENDKSLTCKHNTERNNFNSSVNIPCNPSSIIVESCSSISNLTSVSEVNTENGSAQGSRKTRTSASTLSDSGSVSSNNLDFKVCCSYSPNSLNSPYFSMPASSCENNQVHDDTVSSNSSPTYTFRSNSNDQFINTNLSTVSLNPDWEKFVGSNENNFDFDNNCAFSYFPGTNSLEVNETIKYLPNPTSSCSDSNNKTNGKSQCNSSSKEQYPKSASEMSVAVHSWLKTLRLHKYANLFHGLTYEEMLNITDEWLKSQAVTQGARNKILLNIQKLKGRSNTLMCMEKYLLNAPSGPIAQTVLYSCLAEIKYILTTPIKSSGTINGITNLSSSSSPSSSSSSSDCDQTRTSITGYSFPNVNKSVDSSVIKLDKMEDIPNECFYDFDHDFTNHPDKSNHDGQEKNDVGSLTNNNNNPGLLNHLTEDLPEQIINCLTKVCSHLLVHANPELGCCGEFLQILEIILNHSSFTIQQKKLVISWRKRMLVVHEQLLHQHANYTHNKNELHHKMHPSRSFTRPCRIQKCPLGFTGSDKLNSHYRAREKQSFPSNNLILSTDCLSNSLICSVRENSHSSISSSRLKYNTKDVMDNQLTANPNTSIPTNVTHPVTNQSNNNNNNNSRRHSVPVSEIQNFVVPIKPNQRRRMPSPNPAYLSNHTTTSTSVNNNINNPTLNQNSSTPQIYVQQQRQHISCDRELIANSFQLPKTRFHSPSRFDSSVNFNTYRNLMPPATAPTTRMPSPSDTNRNTYVYGDWSSSNTLCHMNTINPNYLFASNGSSHAPSIHYENNESEYVDIFGQIVHHIPMACIPTPFDSHRTIANNVRNISDVTDHSKPCSNSYDINMVDPQSYSHFHYIPLEANNQPSSDHFFIPPSNRPNNTENFMHSPEKLRSYGSAPTQPHLNSGCNVDWPAHPNSLNLTPLQVNVSHQNEQVNTDLSLDYSNDRIDRDLDLLTREVTELAIGGFDSPLE